MTSFNYVDPWLDMELRRGAARSSLATKIKQRCTCGRLVKAYTNGGGLFAHNTPDGVRCWRGARVHTTRTPEPDRASGPRDPDKRKIIL